MTAATVPCANCGRSAAIVEHQFFEGNPERPVRQWSIFAPLRFKADEQNLRAIEGYCSAECAVARAFPRNVV